MAEPSLDRPGVVALIVRQWNEGARGAGQRSETEPANIVASSSLLPALCWRLPSDPVFGAPGRHPVRL